MTESITIHRLRVCASPECRRLFAVCRDCGWTRRYCSSSCRDETRRKRVREAGERYQQSLGGRQAHAARQALYRERQRVQGRALASPPVGSASETGSGANGSEQRGLAKRSPASHRSPNAACSRADESGERQVADGKESRPAERTPAPLLTSNAASVRADTDQSEGHPDAGCRVRRSAEVGMTSTSEDTRQRALSEHVGHRDDGEPSRPSHIEERCSADRDDVPALRVTHQQSGLAPSMGGPGSPSEQPLRRSQRHSAGLARNCPSLLRCAFCGRGDHRTFLIVHDAPPPDPARPGRGFRSRPARKPAGPKKRGF